MRRLVLALLSVGLMRAQSYAEVNFDQGISVRPFVEQARARVILAQSKGPATAKIAGATKPTLESLQGTYKGISPTDESAIVYGEMEITIDREKIVVRMATGHRIQVEEMKTRDFKAVNRAELEKAFKPGSEYIGRSVGFKADKGAMLIFLSDPKEDEYGLIVTGSMADLLGPTILLSPAQIQRGDFDKLLISIEQKAGKNKLPRLQYNGKVAP